MKNYIVRRYSSEYFELWNTFISTAKNAAFLFHRDFMEYHDDRLVCGTTVFITDKVVKPQYISGNEDNNDLGSLDFLYDFLINNFSKGKDYFDFGPSHENQGLNIVASINFWKESFGAKSLVQDFYEVETANYPLLENIMI